MSTPSKSATTLQQILQFMERTARRLLRQDNPIKPITVESPPPAIPHHLNQDDSMFCHHLQHGDLPVRRKFLGRGVSEHGHSFVVHQCADKRCGSFVAMVRDARSGQNKVLFQGRFFKPRRDGYFSPARRIASPQADWHPSSSATGRTRFVVNGMTALVLWSLLIASQARAQDQIHSADLTKQWQSIVENMGAAQASDQQAYAKATDLLSAAEAAKARANDTNLPPQTRFENHAAFVEFESRAAQAQLDAARQNTKYLTAAAAALGAVRKDLQIESPQNDSVPVFPADQHPVDTGLTPFKYAAGDGVDIETAQELREARQFYQAVSDGSARGMDGIALCQKLERRLNGWQARNRRHLVMADSALRRLELSAVSGLAGVISLSLDQGSTNLSALAFSMDLAPEVSVGTGTSPFASSADKVPLNDVLGGR